MMLYSMDQQTFNYMVLSHAVYTCYVMRFTHATGVTVATASQWQKMKCASVAPRCQEYGKRCRSAIKHYTSMMIANTLNKKLDLLSTYQYSVTTENMSHVHILHRHAL